MGKNLLNRPLCWIVVLATLVVFARGILLLAFPPGWLSPVELKLEVRMEPKEDKKRKDELFLQVFQDTGRGMNEVQSRRIPLVDSGEYEWTRIVLPHREWERIRLDGPPLAEPFSIRSLQLISDEQTLSWSGEELANVLRPTEQLVVEGTDADGGILYRSVGLDPQFDFAVDFPVPQIGDWALLQRLIVPLGITWLALIVLGNGLVFLVRIWREMRQPQGILAGGRGVAAGVGLLLVLVLYGTLGAQAEKKPVPQHMAGHNLYFHLTEAFLHGQLYLLEEPARPLLEMENPFDPVVNERLRLHDASFFDGRYFVYFGPAPVVWLYIPWQVLTGTDLPDRWADTFLLGGAFVFLFLIFLRASDLARTGERTGMGEPVSRAKPSNVGLIGGFLAISLTTGSLFLMARSVVYEVALSSALFWMAAAVFLAFEGVRNERRCRVLFFSGLSLGMAMGSRHSFVLASAVLVAATALYLLIRVRPWGVACRKWVALVLPTALIGFLLLAHNEARFEDPLEFGHNYQIGVVDPQNVDFLDSENIPYNLAINLFQPPAFYPPFPWIHLRGQELLDWISPPRTHIKVESGLGLLIANPYLLGLPFLFLAALRRVRSFRLFWLWAVLASVAAVNFLIIALFSYSAPRYAVDYVPWMVVLFSILWVCALEGGKGSRRQIVLNGVLFVLLGWSICFYFGLALDRIL